jgi:hypothetical protein
VGGTLGTFWLTWFIGKWGFIPVLTTCFLVASASVAAIGQPDLALWMLVTVVSSPDRASSADSRR